MPNAHTVPRAYLVGFADKNQLVVINRNHPVAEQVRAQDTTSIKDVSTRPDYYALRRSTGLDEGPERALGLMEKRIFHLRKALRTGPLSDDDLRDWTVLAGAQHMRGRNRNLMAAPFREMMDRARSDAAAQGHDGDEAVRAFVQRRIGNGDVVHDAQNLALLVGPEIIQAALNWFNAMYKCILTSVALDFITSDEPVVLFDPVAANSGDEQALKSIPRSPNCEVTYPLARRYCLLMSYKPIVPEASADDWTVETVNARTAWFSKDEVYVPPSDARGQDALLSVLSDKAPIFRSLAARYAAPIGTPTDAHPAD
jgi:hypothetical protein